MWFGAEYLQFQFDHQTDVNPIENISTGFVKNLQTMLSFTKLNQKIFKSFLTV